MYPLKNKVLKFISAFTAAVLTASVMGGCGKKSDNSLVDENILDKKSPVTITVWHYYNGVQQTKFEGFVKKFNETVGTENGIIVESVTKNSISELNKSIVSAVDKEPGADETPDIITCYADTAYVLDNKESLVDLKKYFTDDELSEYVDDYIKEGEFDGETLKIFPTAKSTEVMFINKTDWDKFAQAENVTLDDLSTWESLVKTAEKYYNYTDALTPITKNDGKALFGRDSISNYMTIGLEQLGTNLVEVDDQGNAVYKPDKKAVKKLWENFYVPYVKGYFASESRFRSDDMKIGKIIAAVGSTAGAIYYSDDVTINDDYTYPIENQVIPVPDFEGTKPCPVQQGAGMSVLKSDEKSQYASSVFIKWFTDTQTNIEFSAESGYLPVKKEANDFEKIQKVIEEKHIETNKTTTDTMKVAIDEIKNSQLFYQNPYKNSDEFRDALEKGMEESAESDYKKALTKIKKGVDRNKVIEDFTSDDAFEIWYKKFETNLKKAL